MPKLKDIEFDIIPYKENNMTKVKLSINEKNVEGIWICVSDETKILLNKNTSDDYFIARLANDALNFFPNRSWGLHILCKTNGTLRPLCDLNWIDYSKKENRFWAEDSSAKDYDWKLGNLIDKEKYYNKIVEKLRF